MRMKNSNKILKLNDIKSAVKQADIILFKTDLIKWTIISFR